MCNNSTLKDIYLYYATSHQTLNRLSEKRSCVDWFQSQLNDDSTRFIPIWQTKNLTSMKTVPSCVALSRHELNSIDVNWNSAILLGEMDDCIYFGIEVICEGERNSEPLTSYGVFCDLKEHAPVLFPSDCGLMSYARMMIDWQRQNRYCGVCGHPTRSTESGHVLKCTDEACEKQHFPGTDMAVIVLVKYEDKCLLARPSSWPERRYSLLAGFVEPAESFEDAVRREVYEETGLELSEIQFITSQPWPFPNSIMIGYTAEAKTISISVDKAEIQDARWFSRGDLQSSIQDSIIDLPSITSIAYHLIAKWYDAGNKGALDTLLGRNL